MFAYENQSFKIIHCPFCSLSRVSASGLMMVARWILFHGFRCYCTVPSLWKLQLLEVWQHVNTCELYLLYTEWVSLWLSLRLCYSHGKRWSWHKSPEHLYGGVVGWWLPWQLSCQVWRSASLGTVGRVIPVCVSWQESWSPPCPFASSSTRMPSAMHWQKPRRPPKKRRFDGLNEIVKVFSYIGCHIDWYSLPVQVEKSVDIIRCFSHYTHETKHPTETQEQKWSWVCKKLYFLAFDWTDFIFSPLPLPVPRVTAEWAQQRQLLRTGIWDLIQTVWTSAAPNWLKGNIWKTVVCDQEESR